MAYLSIPADESAGRMAAKLLPPGHDAYREALLRSGGGHGVKLWQLRRPSASLIAFERAGPDRVFSFSFEVLSAKY